MCRQDFENSFEIVVADNACDNATRDLVREYANTGARVIWVDASAEKGRSFACNAGVAAARGQLILFCDDDDVAEPGWIRAMAAALERHDVVGGTLDASRINADPDMIYARAVDGATDLPKAPGFLAWAVGCNVGIRASVYREIAGHRTYYFGGGEDQALCFHAQLHGYTMGFASEAVMNYRLRTSVRSLMRQQYRYGYTQNILEAEFGDVGMPQTTWGAIARYAGHLTLRSPNIFLARRRRLRWLGKISFLAGWAVGYARRRMNRPDMQVPHARLPAQEIEPISADRAGDAHGSPRAPGASIEGEIGVQPPTQEM
jgi:GT2 family glycosyltransferase